ncbi:MAG: hypothetical protein JW829_11050 [Pirellulales bacterium]|nr:hypothetical protein [Pirellulales bacterium]
MSIIILKKQKFTVGRAYLTIGLPALKIGGNPRSERREIDPGAMVRDAVLIWYLAWFVLSRPDPENPSEIPYETKS